MKSGAVFPILFSVGCASFKGGPPAGPTLRFGVGPFLASSAQTRTAYLGLQSYLLRELNQRVELVVAETWNDLTSDISGGSVDMALMAPLSYVLAHHNGGVEVVATLLTDGQPFFRSVIFASARSGIRSLQRLRGKSFSFGNRGAFSGYYLPLHHLKKILHFESPEEFFSSVTYDNPWEVIEKNVASGGADAGVDWDGNRSNMLEDGEVKAAASRILWQSPPIPNDAFAVSKNLSRDSATVQRLRRALVTLAIREPSILPQHSTGFVLQDHGFYNSVEEVALAEKVLSSDTASSGQAAKKSR